jgi:hypothetical protein
MNAGDKPVEAPNVSCEICRKEVPREQARHAEVDDYVLYFCGIECYNEWKCRGGRGLGEE